MCSGHAFGVPWIEVEDQRHVGGMLLGCLGVLGGPLEVLGRTLRFFVCVLGCPQASLWPLGMSWERPGGPLG